MVLRWIAYIFYNHTVAAYNFFTTYFDICNTLKQEEIISYRSPPKNKVLDCVGEHKMHPVMVI